MLTGVALRLLGGWLTALRDRAEPAFAVLPAVLEVCEADIAWAYDAPVTEGPAVAVRLMFDPSPRESADSFLSVQPPDDYPASAGEFLAGALPPRAQLMVKHEISVAGRAEYPWAYVTSWSDPARVLGNSAGGAALDPGIRAGRPAVVSAGTIIDWAIWIDGKGIVEGGQTNVLAQGRPAHG